MCSMMGGNSILSLYNKLLLYKQFRKSIWSYGTQLRGCTKQSNSDLHRDLEIETVNSEIKSFSRSHEEILYKYVNVEVIQLLDNVAIVRKRLKRTKPFELV